MSDSLTILAVKLVTENNRRILGVAYAEPSSDILGVAEFIENDQFSNLEVCANFPTCTYVHVCVHLGGDYCVCMYDVCPCGCMMCVHVDV